ncbi:hypothetical protein FIBSPDRAFT_891409 [Athelia psychrophila]|uniref:Uncharacterized protein n=1 Tax=Athelia psychrophila TaxID=1759441 RepID=A0A166JMC4_9AGAM|nr:hypothetical protein FIBSPDRAFT_891409 [Fibularhizoctonia sp. CBS 109695]
MSGSQSPTNTELTATTKRATKTKTPRIPKESSAQVLAEKTSSVMPPGQFQIDEYDPNHQVQSFSLYGLMAPPAPPAPQCSYQQEYQDGSIPPALQPSYQDTSMRPVLQPPYQDTSGMPPVPSLYPHGYQDISDSQSCGLRTSVATRTLNIYPIYDNDPLGNTIFPRIPDVLGNDQAIANTLSRESTQWADGPTSAVSVPQHLMQSITPQLLNRWNKNSITLTLLHVINVADLGVVGVSRQLCLAEHGAVDGRQFQHDVAGRGSRNGGCLWNLWCLNVPEWCLGQGGSRVLWLHNLGYGGEKTATTVGI